LKYLNNISIKPGQNWFVSWYMVSVHFPLIAASCGPLANMLAVVALVDPWKVETDVSQSRKSVHRDLVWILSCNGVSLFCGCLANISLLLNFSGRVRYNVSQAISIGGFLTGSLILIALVIASNSVYDFNNPINASEYKPSQGYWYAVITASMYFLCFIMLLMNEIGHIRGIYGASFNLNRPQRSFMLQNIAYVGWILGGAGLFTFLLSEHVSYPDAIYYAQVTVLTIGFGDFHATSILGRALCLPYALVGILLLGLIVNSIRQIILKSGSYTVMWHFSETNRRHGLKKKPVNNLQESSDQNEKTNLERASFHNIRKIHNNARRYYKWFTLFISLLTFLIFMGLGAMVFLFAESWSYFTAIYFCSLSVLTIGYGDTVPTNSAGKAFFVVWSFVAVPTMTILVTSLLETIVKWVIVVTDRFGGWAFGNQSELRHQTQKLRDSMSRFQASSTQSLPQRPSAHKHRRNRHRHDHENNPKIDSLSTEVKYLVEICKALDQSMRMVLAEPDKKYTFDEWNNMIELSQRHSSILDKSSVNQA
ncbi:voltage-gated potassium channel, partial [Nadsonia fulvescens var. elongata DSM 6958]